MRSRNSTSSSLRKIVVFGGSFNPSAMHHKLIAEKLSEVFDLVLMAPCGTRNDKPSTTMANAGQRKTMAILTFHGTPKVELDFYDLENDVFTPTYLLQERYQKRFPDSEIWFAIGDDLVKGGHDGNSEIQKSWKKGKEIWRNLNFVVISQPDKMPNILDLPPSAEALIIEIILGRSTTLRERIAAGESIDGFVTPEVAQYIKNQGLYC